MNQSFINTAVLLEAFEPRSPANHAYFFLTFVTYVVTMLVNLALVAVIYADSSLHKPMYVFLLNLAVNGAIGCTAVCPGLMSNLLSDAPSISYGGCLLQVMFINVYASSTYAILVAMGYDRYVSICKPLQYHSIMTPGKVRLLLALVNSVPIALVAVQVYLASRLPLCRFSMDKVFCNNLAVLKLACVRSALADLYGVVVIAVLVALPFCLVIMSYVQILRVSLRASTESRRKALGTCAPHLIVFVNFSLCCLFSGIYNRYDRMHRYVNFFQTVQFIFLPPLLHPIVYGMRTREIRRSVAKFIRQRILSKTQDFKAVNKCKIDVV